jgi:hypothetical protein
VLGRTKSRAAAPFGAHHQYGHFYNSFRKIAKSKNPKKPKDVKF